MTSGEQKMLLRGLAAGLLMGVAIGLVIALFVVMKPHNPAALVAVGIGTLVAVSLPLWSALRVATRPNEIRGPKRR